MNKKLLIVALTALMLILPSIALADPSSTGTTSGVQLDDTAITINLCTKQIPTEPNVGWGVCTEDATPKGTFSYEPSGNTLRFNAEASGLGGYTYDYPEVTNLSLAGATYTTLRWSWDFPNREYFIRNDVSVNESVSGNNVLVTQVFPYEHPQVTVTGLTPGMSYTITVKSVYNTPAEAQDHEYSLIYYRDTDPFNVNPSEKGYLLLDQAPSSDGIVSFSGYQFIGENIPMSSDVNVRGKIWIVPTSELNNDGTLKWTNYALGNTMTDYLFESDLPGGTTHSEWIGGITYTYTP